MRKLAVAVVLTALAACLQASAQTPAPAAEDGKLLEQAAYQMPAFEEIGGWYKQQLTREAYDRIRNSTDLELLKIRYASDGLRVAGFIYKPRQTEGRKFPVVIYNRGGLGPGSEIGPENFYYVYEMHRLATEGFVVLASQYRGYDGAGGRDEAGGADTHDVMNIVKLARTLPYADTSRMFMWGYSRGAIMTLQAIRDGVPLRAAAVVGAPTDYFEFARQRGEAFFLRAFPDYEKNKEELLTNRSAMRWVEKINVPILFLHGGADPSIPPSQVHRLAEKLEERGVVYEMVVYAKDVHPVALNLEDRVNRTVRWFKNPPTPSVAQALRKVVEAEGVAAAVRRYRELKKTAAADYDFSEPELNTLGYELLGAGRASDAVEIFKLNVEMFPDAFNTYDSLGEAYLAAGERELAIQNYRRSLELNPQNTNAAAALKRVGQK